MTVFPNSGKEIHTLAFNQAKCEWNLGKKKKRLIISITVLDHKEIKNVMRLNEQRRMKSITD